MPELPEVEAFKYLVETTCLNKKVVDIKSTAKELIKHNFVDFKNNLIGHKFTQVERLGKYLLLTISSSDFKLVLHFGLTGFLEFTTDTTQKVKFSKVEFIFSDAILHWISIRKFEKIWLIKDFKEIKGLSTLGPDALKISKADFIKLADKYKTKNIKAFLMDQKIISGIGNEYCDEILFQAGIDPHHFISELTSKNITDIYNQIHKVLDYAIKLRIANIKQNPTDTFQSKRDLERFKFTYLQAHRHIDGLCPKNKNHHLKKVTIAGRSTYYCPIDQK